MTEQEFHCVVARAVSRGFTVSTIAAAADVSQPIVRRWMLGRTSPASPALRRMVAGFIEKLQPGGET